MCSPPSSGSAATLQLINQIASALDVPASAFFDAKPEITAAERASGTMAEQLLSMIELFKQIEDPAIRDECLDIVRSRAER